jgi:hypothetical protein
MASLSSERPDQVDQPEPEEALSDTGQGLPDHEPDDGDDREVLLDDPEDPESPLDEEP